MRHKPGQERANPFLDFPHSILLHMIPLLLRQTTAFLIAISPCAEVAQLAEHSPEKAGVGSSILPLGTIFLSPPHAPYSMLRTFRALRPD